MIYLDNAATTLKKPPGVAEAVRWAVGHLANPGRGGYAAAEQAGQVEFRCREKVCRLFGVDEPERVVFTSGATHGLNIALHSLLPPGSRVLLSGWEHNAVTRTAASIPDTTAITAGGGLFEPEEFLEGWKRGLEHGVQAAVITHMSNVYGYILPLQAAAEQCRQAGVPLIVDAAQSAGSQRLSLSETGAAFLAIPGHKGLYGPQGVGLLLCGSDRILPLITGGTGSQSRLQTMPDFLPDRLEAGTQNLPGIAGLSAALDYVAGTGAERIGAWEHGLIRRLAEGLEGLPEVQVFYSNHGQGGVLSLRQRGTDGEEIAAALARLGIAVRAGLHCAPLAHHSGGTEDTGTVRLSVSAFTTEREINGAIPALRRVLSAKHGAG